MKNRLIIIFLGLFNFLIGQNKPNVILIVADDLGHQDVSYNGGYIKTPNIDLYQSQSFSFERFYTTAPVCSPTRAAIMTGRIPERLGIGFANSGRLESEEINLAEVLLTEEYQTGHFGKWHLGTLTTDVIDGNRGMPGDSSVYSPPWVNGFMSSFSTENAVPTFDPMAVLNASAYPVDFDDPNYYGTSYWESNQFEKGTRVPIDDLLGDDNKIITDKTLAFLQSSSDNEEPFFCNLWYHTPHLPVVPREDYRNLYTDEEWAAIPDDAKPFVNAISSMDFEIGRVFEFLDQAGQLDNTIIWFMSDNGPTGARTEAVGPFRGRKNVIYEGGIRVPSFLYCPMLEDEGKTIEDAVSTLDILPTIFELIKSENYISDKPIDGTSILPLIDETQEMDICRSRPIFCMKDGLKWKALFQGNYKLISRDNSLWELYNLEEDQMESEDLSLVETEILDTMKNILLDFESHICQDLDYVINECENTSNVVEQDNRLVKFYPNPSRDNLFVDLLKCQSKGFVTIYDLNGREVFNFNIDQPQILNIDLTEFNSGTYLLKVFDGFGHTFVSKFITHKFK